MNDILKQAKELIEKFDGKITQGQWEVVASTNYGYDVQYIALDGESGWSEKPAKSIDEDAMSSVPQMLTVINGLVDMFEESEKRLELSSPFSGDN